MSETAFRPDWAAPPGETISHILERIKLHPLDLAKRLHLTLSETRALIAGAAPISTAVAAQLGEALGGSGAFWQNRESRFREDVARMPIHDRYEAEWLASMPYSDLVRFGWVEGTASQDERAQRLLDFFGVDLSRQWALRYPAASMATAFRASGTYESRAEAISLWLRQGERQAAKIQTSKWDRDGFRRSLGDMRSFTRNKYPSRFFPELRALCAKHGVALIAAPTPPGCRASGATQFLSSTKAMLLLSFRFKMDDQFWFTFFHEAAHLVLHDIDAVFIDENVGSNDSPEEQEANTFAQQILVADELRPALVQLPRRAESIIRFARTAGIAPGIVVGQMQKAGVLTYRQMTSLKRRYPDEEVEAVFSL